MFKTIFNNKLYISFIKTDLSEETIRLYLLNKLRKGEIPSYIMCTKKFPYTSRGKVDIPKLLNMFYISNKEKSNNILYTQKQQDIIELIQNDILNNVKITDCKTSLYNFGIDSLKFIILISLLNNRYNISFDNKLNWKCSINDIINIIDNNKLIESKNFNGIYNVYNYTPKIKYIFAIHGLWGATEFEISANNNNKLTKLFKYPIFHLIYDENIKNKI